MSQTALLILVVILLRKLSFWFGDMCLLHKGAQVFAKTIHITLLSVFASQTLGHISTPTTSFKK